MALGMATTICLTPPRRGWCFLSCAVFALDGAAAGGCCNYLFCTSREWYVRCSGGWQLPATLTACCVRSLVLHPSTSQLVSLCMAWRVLARSSKWAQRCERKGRSLRDTQGDKFSHWCARLRSRAARRGRRWGSGMPNSCAELEALLGAW